MSLSLSFLHLNTLFYLRRAIHQSKLRMKWMDWQRTRRKGGNLSFNCGCKQLDQYKRRNLPVHSFPSASLHALNHTAPHFLENCLHIILFRDKYILFYYVVFGCYFSRQQVLNDIRFLVWINKWKCENHVSVCVSVCAWGSDLSHVVSDWLWQGSAGVCVRCLWRWLLISVIGWSLAAAVLIHKTQSPTVCIKTPPGHLFVRHHCSQRGNGGSVCWSITHTHIQKESYHCFQDVTFITKTKNKRLHCAI